MAPEAAPAAPGDELTIPDEVLMIPEFAGLLQGAPPAMSVERDATGPEIDTVIKNAPTLKEAGIDILEANSGKYVIYNSQYVTPEEVIAADKTGKLEELAPPFAEVKSSIQAATQGKGGKKEAAKPEAPTGMVESNVGGPLPKPAPASAIKSMTNARIKNVTKSEPTQGAVPGAGRVMNSILQPTI